MGGGMKKPSRQKPAKTRPRRALKPKGRSAPKTARRGSVPAGQGTEVARLTRELNEARARGQVREHPTVRS